MSSTKNDQAKPARGNKVSAELDGDIYHEKQSKELCALHALNNLFQEEDCFTKQQLDQICMQLSPDSFLNPHKSWLGLGNYDVNVLMSALQNRDYDTLWFDKRKNVNYLVLDKIKGFILNIPTNYSVGYVHIPVKRKHWIAVRQIGYYYYNLDSKLDSPEKIGNKQDMIYWLREQISSKEKELLLVVEQKISQEASWYDSDKKEESNSSGKKSNLEVGSVELTNDSGIYSKQESSVDKTSSCDKLS